MQKNNNVINAPSETLDFQTRGTNSPKSKRTTFARKTMISLAGFLLLSMLFIPAFAQTTIVASAISVGSKRELRTELILYQADDADPLYDYYFVQLKLVDIRWQNDWLINPGYLRVYLYANTYYYTSQKLQYLLTYRQPNPGWTGWQDTVTVSFYGVGIPIRLPQSLITFTTSGNNVVQWTVDSRPYIAMLGLFAMGALSEFGIGFRVPEGKGIQINAYSYCEWYVKYGALSYFSIDQDSTWSCVTATDRVGR